MTVEELYGQMVDTFQRETGLALAGDGDMAVRLYAVAAQLYALYVQADWVGRQCFPQTAQGDYLDKHAQLRGLERRAATAAVGVLSFETDHPPEADLSIPEGTVCMTAAQVRGRPPPRCGPERWSRARGEMRRPGRCGPWRWRRWG